MNFLHALPVTLLAAVSCLGGCSPIISQASLAGDFAYAWDAERKVAFRVEKKDGQYLYSFDWYGHWGKPVVMKPVDKAYLEKLLKEPINVPFAALGMGIDEDIIVQVPIGWRWGAFESKTGFWIYGPQRYGPYELRKL